MAALGLPAALLLGVLADLVTGLLRDRRPAAAVAPVSETWSDLRRLVRRREGLGLPEAAGGIGALVGAGIVAAASLGAAPGSLPLLYLALAASLAGTHLAAALPTTKVADARATTGRRVAALAEVAMVAALGAAFLRWNAGGLEAIRGAQGVLGTGFVVGPATAAVGLGLAVAVLLVATGLRLPPSTEASRGRGRPAGSAVLVRVCRWALSGATALLAAALLAGRDVLGVEPDGLLGVWMGTAVGGALVIGAARAGMDLLRGRWARAAVVAGLWAGAAGAVVLVMAR